MEDCIGLFGDQLEEFLTHCGGGAAREGSVKEVKPTLSLRKGG